MKKNKKIRYAVMGLGHICQEAVLPAFKHAEANSELVALISSDALKLKKVAKRYRIPAHAQFSYEQFPECLQTIDADVLYIATPNHLHTDFALQAMDLGVHVLCEKPLAISSEDCAKLHRKSQQRKVHLMTAYRLHFEKANLEAARLAQSEKALGELRLFSSVFTMQVKDEDNIRLGATKKGGGPLWDIGIYCINAVRGLFRSEPLEVFAFSANNGEKRFSKTEEMLSVTMKFPQERLANFVCSFGADNCATYDLVGTKGRLRVENAYEYAMGREIILHKDDKIKRRSFKKADQFAAELVYFSDCVKGRRKPEPSAMEGRADVQVIEALLKSLETGAPVRLGQRKARSLRYPRPTQLIQRPGLNPPKVIRATPPSAQ